MTTVSDLTRQLIEIPSPSGAELPVAEFLDRRLRDRFTVRLIPVGKSANVLATVGTPRVLLSSHLDTVPGQLPVREDKTVLFGRGACDAKGIVAAMVLAAERIVDEGRTDFGLLFTVSEETDFAGIVAAQGIVNPEIVIIGEPTSCTAYLGQKGLLGLTISSTGKEASGAQPEGGRNAITQLMDALTTIRTVPLPSSELGTTVLNIGVIEGGTAPNVIPGKARARLELRTTVSTATICATLKDAITDPFTDLAVDYAFETMPSNPPRMPLDIPQAMVAPYFSELAFWPRSKRIILGPGDYAFAHTANEQVNKAELERGAALYARLLREWTVLATVG